MRSLVTVTVQIVTHSPVCKTSTRPTQTCTYYDGTTGTTGTYFWWDPAKKEYAAISGPSTSGQGGAAGLAQAADAKKVAVDMEKWAKKRKKEDEKAKKLKISQAESSDLSRR
jgi:hypothetical protein